MKNATFLALTVGAMHVTPAPAAQPAAALWGSSCGSLSGLGGQSGAPEMQASASACKRHSSSALN